MSYSRCSITVLGMEMACPLCGILVKSGVSHTCEKPEPSPPKKRRVLRSLEGK